jgi:hypothetical protein
MVTRCAASGECSENGRTLMEKISKSVDLPDGTGQVVIFEPKADSKQEHNLVCLGEDGQIKWTAQLPTTEPADCFVEVRIENDLVVANSISCYAVWIDPTTGQILQTQSTK